MGDRPDSFRPGEVIGPYELRERVRAGDLSETFRAFDRGGNRWVTLTRLRPEVALRGTAVAEFVRDAEALAAVDHPAIVAVSRGEDDLGLPFTVREDVRGELLSSLLERHPEGLSVPVAMSIAAPIAGALAEVHGRGAVHGNPGAGYVLLTDERGRAPVLVGFGMSDTSAMLGVSPERALAVAPERLMGSAPDAASDVYSFAALVYEMVAGEPPASEGAALQAAVDDVPAALSRIVQRCLSAQKDRRPPIGELQRVLDELAPRQSEFPVPEKVSSISQSLRPPEIDEGNRRAPRRGTSDVTGLAGDGAAGRDPGASQAQRPSQVTGPESLMDLASELASKPPPAAPTVTSAPAEGDDSFAGLLESMPPGGASVDATAETVMMKTHGGDDSFAGLFDDDPPAAGAAAAPRALASGTADTHAMTSLAPATPSDRQGSLPPPSAWSEDLDSVPAALRGASSGPPGLGSVSSGPPGTGDMHFNISAQSVEGATAIGFGGETDLEANVGAGGGGEFSIPPPAEQAGAGGDSWRPSRIGYDDEEDRDHGAEFSLAPAAGDASAVFDPPPADAPQRNSRSSLLEGSVPPLPQVPPANPLGAPPPPPPTERSLPPPVPRPPPKKAVAPPPRRSLTSPQRSLAPPVPPAAKPAAKPAAPVPPPKEPERADDLEAALATGTFGGGSWGGNAAQPAAPTLDSRPPPASEREDPDDETLARRRERRRRRRPGGVPDGLTIPMVASLATWVLFAAFMSPMIFAVDVSLVQARSGVDGRVAAVSMMVLGVLLISRVWQGGRASKSWLLIGVAGLMGLALFGLGFLTLELFLPPESLGPLRPIARLSATWGLAFMFLALCAFCVTQIRNPKLNLSMATAVLLGFLALEALFGTAWVVSRSLRVADGVDIAELYYSE